MPVGKETTVLVGEVWGAKSDCKAKLCAYQ